MIEQGRGRTRTREGVVVSDRPDKSAVVLVKRQILHRRYGKAIVLSKKYMVHDERNEARVGDRVLICEGRSGRNKDDIGAFLKEISCLSWQAMSVRANMPGRDGEARRLHERLCRVRDEGMGDLADALAKADSSMLGTFKTAILKM